MFNVLPGDTLNTEEELRTGRHADQMKTYLET